MHLAALPFCLTEVSKYNVNQNPSAMMKHPGDAAVIKCSHSNSDWDMIQWYKRSAGTTEMVLLGYARYSILSVEDPFKNSYNVSGTGSSLSSLHMLKLTKTEDGAVFFCAARQGGTVIQSHRGAVQKPPAVQTD